MTVSEQIMMLRSGDGASETQLRVVRPHDFGLVVLGIVGGFETPSDYLHEQILTPELREVFFELVASEGLVCCKNIECAHPLYRDVRGRSSRGRLSQGEYYHHDGCSGPRKPRVNEIRCPIQEVSRQVATAIAPFPQTVEAMVRCLPASMIGRNTELAQLLERLDSDGNFGELENELIQGKVTRAIRRDLQAEGARAYFRDVDAEVQAYVEPWEMGESRFMANACEQGKASVGTMQHRRAYLTEHRGGQSNGHLVKRWPREELDPNVERADFGLCSLGGTTN